MDCRHEKNGGQRGLRYSNPWAPISTSVLAQQADDRATIIVTAPGDAIDADDARKLSADDISRSGPLDILGALTRTMAGVTLQDGQGNPWQPNLVYRGFIASPLQGQAQGLAVYLDGARFTSSQATTCSR